MRTCVIKWQTVSMALMVVSSIDAAWQPSSVDPPSHIPAKAATLLQNSIPSLQALSHTTSINSLSTLNKTCHLKSLQPNFYLIEEAQSPTTYFSPSSHFQLCIFFSSSFGCWRLNSLPLKACFMKHLYKLKLSKKNTIRQWYLAYIEEIHIWELD